MRQQFDLEFKTVAVGVSAQIRGTFSFNLNFRGIFLLIKVKDSK